MKFTRIKDGIAGERTAAVEPRPAPEVEATWQRERFVTGRTVSAAALEAEQDHRAGRVTGLAQALRAGVCDGLEVEAAQDGSNRLRLLTVAAGWGLCANGEDVVVPETLTVQAGQLPVRLTPSVRFGKLAETSTSREPTLTELLSLRASLIKQIDKATRITEVETPPTRSESAFIERAEATGSRRTPGASTDLVSFATVRSVSMLASLPRFKARPFAAVLVLEPARVEELAGAGDPSRDPCERDPEAEPFEDWRYVDAARLCWIPVETLADERPDPPSTEPPMETTGTRTDAVDLGSSPTIPRALPADPWFKHRVNATDGQRFRNELAWALFREESALGPDETLPWSRDALPIALVAFSGLGDILWVDRAAVVRSGGLRTEGAPTGVERGGPALWQARIEQLNQQLAGLELDATAPLSTHVRYLPPAGVLPAELLDANERACKAFPAGWGLNAAPIPIDQLDATIRGAAALDPFDLDSPDNEEIKLLVPVAPPLWDPHLLQIESVHPAFQATLRRVEGRRDEMLERRVEIRTKISALYAAIGREASLPIYPTDDTGDTAAEDIAAAVLWSNPSAFTVFNTLGSVSTLPLLGSSGAINGAAAAFTDVPNSTAQITAALTAISATEPCVVVPAPAGSTPSTVSGPGFELPGGWSAPFQVTHAEGQLSVAREPVVYIVQGTLDTESIDAAASAAGANPVVILCAALSELAAEDLAFRARRASQLDPLVVVVRGTESTRLDRLADVSARLGGAAVLGRPADTIVQRPSSGAAPVTLVVADTVRTTFVLPNASALTTSANTRLAALQAARVAATDTATQLLLDARLTTFKGKAAALFVPDDRPHAASEVALAVRMIQALRAVDKSPSSLGELRLLDIAASREAPYGTAPTSDGLGVAVIEELESALYAKITPPVGQRVVTDAEVGLLGTLGLAGLMAVLGEKAKRADDAADFGFLQLQALLFKVREQLMGRDKALQMSASPMMANLADLIEGEGTPEQLSKYFDELKDAAADKTQATTQPSWMREAIKNIVSKETLYSTVGGVDPSSPMSSLRELDLPESIEHAAVATPGAAAAPQKRSMNSLAFGGTKLRHDRSVDVEELSARIGVPAVETAGTTARNLSDAMAMAMSFAPAAGGTTTSAPGGGTTSTTRGTFWSAPEVGEALSQGAPNAASLGTSSISVARMVHSAQFLRKIQPYAWTLRATGVKKRAEDARAIELRQEAFRLRASVLQTIARLEINLAGLYFPGFLETYNTGAIVDGKPVTGIRAVEKVLIGTGVDTSALVAAVLQGKHDLQTPDANTASLNSDAIQSLEITASMLRIVEGRVREVREVIELCRRAKIQIERQIYMAEQREDAILTQLAEARHDVSATSALVAEEVARVEAVNARREKILANEVPFLVYHRCRMVELADDVAIHDLEPALMRSPVLEALRRPAPRAPEELRELVESWRDAPARWLRPLVPLLPKVDTLASLIKALLDAQQRATRRLEQAAPPPRQVRGLRGMAAVAAMIQARQAAVTQSRAAAASLNAATIQAMNWRNAQIRAIQALSVEDLINSRAVRASVSRQAAHELENIYKVSANIYREFTEVAPELRAIWVRMLSEYDDPIDLHDLSRLPRWREVGQGDDGRRPDPFKKRELQALVTWLFDRVDPGEAEAREMMNDLVRVCILLASHAPVERILAGQVETVTPIEPDRQLSVKLPGAARVGMMAIIRTKSGVATHARVVDVAEGRASLRLVGPAIAGVVLQAGDQVHLSEPDGVSVEDDDDDGPEERNGPLFLRASKTDGR